ncbi:virion structural protein [Pseudomonas phage PA1C]|uniref:Virion structural protein n=1 Tax=Pseudomonas phage vB_PaeM_PS119XW TaxID=2601632 RepID=A0A5C1K7E6_9CAUD|nr:hypothetical protein PP933_gp096 [Pseudomonas phage vB_PaeM_PS119XW]QBX32248.1 virion structural protein [Pseudomonas phage PA1C]QEM41825.1 hypothetical protein [Pseudomonas phage vB_PaeM_PS119XW]BEG72733.1 hypothetical protein RVBP21_3610 [Pseudomonas phage BRkr]
MSILNYVQQLAPVMERRQLLNVLDQLQTEYDDTLAPIVSDVREAFQGIPLKSNLAKRMENVLRRGITFNQPAIDLMLGSLDNIRGNFEVIRKEIRSLFSIQFTNTNLTFDRANMLKFIEGLAFYIRFGRKYLLFLVAQEAALHGKATRAAWTSAESDWIDTNMEQFAALYPAMTLQPQALKQKLNAASNATVDESTFQVAQQNLGLTKTDPLGMAGFSPRQNPFLIIGKLIAEMQAERYNVAQEEYYGLQLRLEELRALLAKEPTSPVLQKQIEAYERRISAYEYEINKIEERAGVQ